MRNIQISQTSSISRELREQAAEAVIDAHRFGTPRRNLVSRILSQYEDVPAVLPTHEEMTQMGGDIIAIAAALEAGLSVKAFGKAIQDGLNLGLFCNALKCGFKPRGFAGLVRRNDIEIVNEGLDHFVDYHNDNPHPRNIMERVSRMFGEELAATC